MSDPSYDMFFQTVNVSTGSTGLEHLVETVTVDLPDLDIPVIITDTYEAYQPIHGWCGIVDEG